MIRQVVLGCFFVAYLAGQNLFAQDYQDSTRSNRWYLPHYVPVQFAGNFHLNILYGYVPASVAKTAIHTITAKNIFPITRYPVRNNQTLIPYLGLGLTVEVGGNAFFRMPSHFPESYYDFPKNVHVIAFGGAKLQHLFSNDSGFVRGLEFYGEAGTIDLYVWYKVTSGQIKFNQIFSLAVGINLLLDY